MALSQHGMFYEFEHTDVLANATYETITCSTTSGVLYDVFADNSDNVTASYVKLYDTSTPEIGTTAPSAVIRVEAGKAQGFPLGDMGQGHAVSTSATLACVTAGGKGGTTSPDEAVRTVCHTS